jgi:hypothetical protein
LDVHAIGFFAAAARLQRMSPPGVLTQSVDSNAFVVIVSALE